MSDSYNGTLFRLLDTWCVHLTQIIISQYAQRSKTITSLSRSSRRRVSSCTGSRVDQTQGGIGKTQGDIGETR